MKERKSYVKAPFVVANTCMAIELETNIETERHQFDQNLKAIAESVEVTEQYLRLRRGAVLDGEELLWIMDARARCDYMHACLECCETNYQLAHLCEFAQQLLALVHNIAFRIEEYCSSAANLSSLKETDMQLLMFSRHSLYVVSCISYHTAYYGSGEQEVCLQSIHLIHQELEYAMMTLDYLTAWLIYCRETQSFPQRDYELSDCMYMNPINTSSAAPDHPSELEEYACISTMSSFDEEAITSQKDPVSAKMDASVLSRTIDSDSTDCDGYLIAPFESSVFKVSTEDRSGAIKEQLTEIQSISFSSLIIAKRNDINNKSSCENDKNSSFLDTNLTKNHSGCQLCMPESLCENRDIFSGSLAVSPAERRQVLWSRFLSRVVILFGLFASVFAGKLPQETVIRKGSYEIPLQDFKRQQALHGIPRTSLHIPEIMNAIHSKKKLAHATYSAAPVFDRNKNYTFDELSSMAYVDSTFKYQLAVSNIYSLDQDNVRSIQHVDEDSIIQCYGEQDPHIGDLFVASELGASFHSNVDVNPHTAKYFHDPKRVKKNLGFVLLRKVIALRKISSDGCFHLSTSEIHPFEIISGFTVNSTIKRTSSIGTHLQYSPPTLDHGLSSCQKYPTIVGGGPSNSYLVSGDISGDASVSCPTNMDFVGVGCVGLQDGQCPAGKYRFLIRCYDIPISFSNYIVGKICQRESCLFKVCVCTSFSCPSGYNDLILGCTAKSRGSANICPVNLSWNGIACAGSSTPTAKAQVAAYACAEYTYDLGGTSYNINYDYSTGKAQQVLTIPGVDGFTCDNCYAYFGAEIVVHLDVGIDVDLFRGVTAKIGFETIIQGSVGANVDITVNNLASSFTKYINVLPAERDYHTIPLTAGLNFGYKRGDFILTASTGGSCIGGFTTGGGASLNQRSGVSYVKNMGDNSGLTLIYKPMTAVNPLYFANNDFRLAQFYAYAAAKVQLDMQIQLGLTFSKSIGPARLELAGYTGPKFNIQLNAYAGYQYNYGDPSGLVDILTQKANKAGSTRAISFMVGDLIPLYFTYENFIPYDTVTLYFSLLSGTVNYPILTEQFNVSASGSGTFSTQWAVIWDSSFYGKVFNILVVSSNMMDKKTISNSLIDIDLLYENDDALFELAPVTCIYYPNTSHFQVNWNTSALDYYETLDIFTGYGRSMKSQYVHISVISNITTTNGTYFRVSTVSVLNNTHLTLNDTNIGTFLKFNNTGSASFNMDVSCEQPFSNDLNCTGSSVSYMVVIRSVENPGVFTRSVYASTESIPGTRRLASIFSQLESNQQYSLNRVEEQRRLQVCDQGGLFLGMQLGGQFIDIGLDFSAKASFSLFSKEFKSSTGILALLGVNTDNLKAKVNLFTKTVCAVFSPPTNSPTAYPTATPSGSPPSGMPSKHPLAPPTIISSGSPTGKPSKQPIAAPTVTLSGSPIVFPSESPTRMPSKRLICNPRGSPTRSPIDLTTVGPSSARPSSKPSRLSLVPLTVLPSTAPTKRCRVVSSKSPIRILSNAPSAKPSTRTSRCSVRPSRFPSTVPFSIQTQVPSHSLRRVPTKAPTAIVTARPSSKPSRLPLVPLTVLPSAALTKQSTVVSSKSPINIRSNASSANPSVRGSLNPTSRSSVRPSRFLSTAPFRIPTLVPSHSLTSVPTKALTRPSSMHSRLPLVPLTRLPSTVPTRTSTAVSSKSPID